jgi:RNA polymerase sigma factor (sigma-70 family)
MVIPGERRSRRVTWSDERLVRECLGGREEAWAALVEKYKNLIFSIPIKFGLSSDDAADVFQAVCVDLLTELPRLREPKALAGWLIRVTSHKCIRLQHGRRRFAAEDVDAAADSADSVEVPGSMIEELQREQALREAIRALSPRCQRVVQVLFFESPPWSYQQIAESLGVATGSIGFIRGRCLTKLRRGLEDAGFP